MRAHSAIVLLAFGCQPGADAGDVDAEPDAAVAADIGVEADAAPDAAPEPSCEPVTGETFALDPDGPDTQIHAALIPAPGGVWAAFNRPDPGGGFDVWATRLGCDGSVVVPPFQVNEDAEFNDVDPALARSGERVLFAWATDDGMAPYNLSIRTRLFDDEGTPLGPERRLELEASAWMVRVAPFRDGFLLVGSLGDEMLNAFQLFALEVDRDGALGEPARVHTEPASQTDPALLVVDGEAIVAWKASEGTVRLARGTPTNGFIAQEGFDPAAGPALSPAWVAATDTARGQVIARPLEGGEVVEVGEPGQSDHSPGLATGPEVTAVAWYRVLRGIRNALWYTRLGSDRVPTMVETDGPVAPYGVAITALGDRRFALAWSEGDSPAFRLYWRIVRL